jgi:hypothetical protein
MGIRGRTTTLFLVSTYYETPNLQLRRHNMTASIVSATSRVAGLLGLAPASRHPLQPARLLAALKHPPNSRATPMLVFQTCAVHSLA